MGCFTVPRSGRGSETSSNRNLVGNTRFLGGFTGPAVSWVRLRTFGPSGSAQPWGAGDLGQQAGNESLSGSIVRTRVLLQIMWYGRPFGRKRGIFQA